MDTHLQEPCGAGIDFQSDFVEMPATHAGIFSLTSYRCQPRTPAITISVVRLPERRRKGMMVMAALRRLDALQLVR
jgi:hypothetical protein